MILHMQIGRLIGHVHLVVSDLEKFGDVGRRRR
jgi:hypothetical protein